MLRLYSLEWSGVKRKELAEAAQMLYSVTEAARMLGGISHWTLRKHIAAGRIPVVRLGRRVMVESEEIERICRSGLPSLGR